MADKKDPIMGSCRRVGSVAHPRNTRVTLERHVYSQIPRYGKGRDGTMGACRQTQVEKPATREKRNADGVA